MTTTAERIQVADLKPAEPAGARRPLGLLAALAAIALAAWSLILVSGSPAAGDYVRVSVIALLAVCALSLVWRRPREPMGMLIAAFAATGAVWAVVSRLRAAVFAGATRLLVKWPTNAIEVAAIAALPIPLALAFGATTKRVGRVDRLLTQTVSVAGLTGVVLAIYILIVLGLGHAPNDPEQRTLLLLSMIGAVVAALLYLPTRERLTSIANNIVYGERHAPDEVLRTFGSRLSRAIPLDELLLQMAESLRKTLALDLVEVWTGSGGSLERRVCDPDRPVIHMTIGKKELPVVTRAGVSGPAWIKVWLPQLIEKREGSMVRIAPITHQGELLGMIVVERRDPDESFGEENERVMTELARQVGLALHNAQLDSALQESYQELKRRAEALRASRERIVAAGDAERRKLERNLHDGAQQHLVALAVKVKLVKNLLEADANTAKAMLEELGGDVQEAVQQLRDLAHGIYPPILVDRGLGPALESAVMKAALPTNVVAEGVQRHRQEIEAAVYFCVLEALQNAGKHAGEGATAVVSLKEEPGALLFEVSDNGAGFDTKATGLGAGFTNMSDRVGSIGGTLDVSSEPGKGTKISGRIPL